MPRFLKTFLLWLLIAALPIQGAAAVIQASCGPRHHGMSVVAIADDHHHGAGQAVHSHSADSMNIMDEKAEDVDKGATSKTVKLPVSSYCSACSACCAGAVAPPPSVSLTPTFLTVEAAVLPPVVSFTGFIPAGPERPPRPVSA